MAKPETEALARRLVENLTISPISITMDFIIPESSMDAYYNAENKEDARPVYILMRNGAKVAASFKGYSASTNVFVIFTLEHPIDVGQIQNIVFAGDNDPEKQGSEEGTAFLNPPPIENTTLPTAESPPPAAQRQERPGPHGPGRSNL